MRIPSPIFLRGGAGKGGVIFEDDGELTIPPVLQPMIEFPAPFVVGTAPNASFNEQLRIAQVGIAAAAAQTGQILGAGLWHIFYRVVEFHAGVLDLSKSHLIEMLAPDAATARILFDIAFFNGTQALIPVGELWLHTTEDGWRFRIQSSATVAGDTSWIEFSYNANKVL